MEPRGGVDGFIMVRPTSVCSLAKERCVVRVQLFFEVRAVRHSFDCVLSVLCRSLYCIDHCTVVLVVQDRILLRPGFEVGQKDESGIFEPITGTSVKEQVFR